MPPPTKEELWSSGKDETVEVNQRALIDKILARYSGEHTIFRELLQNADDAGAQEVQVKFYSQQGLDAIDHGRGPLQPPDVKKVPMVRYVVTNDGIPFRDQDWQRLKKIAEGNPDEEKIGAFGVGFYSLWSVCDDPFVESGEKWMGFYWKDGKDQLLARSGNLPPSSSSSIPTTLSGNPWTNFTMALREPTLLEGPLDLARFLVTSLTFMRTIRKINMLVDDIKVFEVEKSVKGQNRVTRKGLKEISPGSMMTVQSVDATGMIITARVMKWLSATGFVPPPLPPPIPTYSKPTKAFASIFSSTFFNRSSPAPTPAPEPTPPPPPENLTEITELRREIQVYQAEIKVTVSPTFAKELERATKKPAPARMPASLVFSRGDEEPTVTGDIAIKKDAAGIFAGLCPPLDGEKGARVFIGQATAQTTGIGGHLAARFIPTVERESIDLVDKHVSHWNRELLSIGGYLSRLIYEVEMVELQQLWSTTSVSDPDTRNQLLKRGLHALKFFTFKPTTPSSVVGQTMESAFFSCSTDKATFPIISTAGILPSSLVRMPDPELLQFLPDLPVLTPAALEEASRQIARLRERGMIRETTFEDVIKQLGLRPLTEKEMVACLQWWQTMAGADGYNTTNVRARLLDAAVLVQDDGKVLPLSIIETFVKPQSSSIPTDMPLPTHTIPYNITKDLKGNLIYPVFGWTELTMLQYITFLIKPPMSAASQASPDTDLRVSPAFAERVLSMLGRSWLSISANQQSAIALELKEVPCIPTKAGFKKPHEAYFEKNLLFDDLPTIALPKNTTIKGGLEKMLLGIGVRKTVDLQLVFSRLIGGGTWTCVDLMKYLVSVKDTLTNEEVARLRQTAAFPMEVETIEGQKQQVIRQKPHQLYEPTDALRALGLPLLAWGEAKWRPSSDEARMLFSLGLKRFPPIDVLVGLAAGPSPINDRALQYLLNNYSTHYTQFDPSAFATVAFIPATSSTGKSFLAKPGEVFINPACGILGFSVAHPSVTSPENAGKLRIPSDPPMDRLAQALISNPPTDHSKAQTIFEYLSTRLGQSVPGATDRLSSAKFIPVKTIKGIELVRPIDVYFASTDTDKKLYSSAFTFVDFGERANVFLRYCGVRSEPSVKDIAKLLMSQPEKMLAQAGSPDKYLEQLRMLAANWTNFDFATKTAMKGSAFVLASQRVPVKKQSKKVFGTWGGTEDEYEREWVLCKASDAALINDITMVQYFGRYILAAPEEQLLETFYEHLGAKPLSSYVRTEYVTSGSVSQSTEEAKALRRHVLERLTIFLAEARRRHSEYTIEELSKEGMFLVQEVRDLKVKYIYKNGKQEQQHLEVLYATAQRGRGKSIILTVSMTAQPDDYDIAAALCPLLLKQAKADDALLLYSILSTPLMALKKRGFNVDRILNQQREERLRLQAERIRDLEKEKQSEVIIDDGVSETSTSTAVDGEKDTKGVKSLYDKLRNRGFGSLSSSMPSHGSGSSHPPTAISNILRDLTAGHGSGSGGLVTGSGVGQTTKRPTDLQSIRNTVQKAVDASRPEMGTQISDSRQAVRDVSESQNEYCDTSAGADLVLAVDLGAAGLRMWVPRDEPDHASYLSDKLGISQRFARDILLPIGQVYKLAPQVLNVFWDREGPLIAFNRGGTIFCNARYYSAWHDTQCIQGNKNDAFISWYFSIAHELAHNLESAHNASHEFYFSSIAEEFLIRFATLLTP
ncbi:hypothetical protein TREMEDRAFT_29286 [Tremella mesenterica DSM 1558]|uniref:uncharacterized protein n=1 Tax=Tremella mesenterica (strain ATCC 24925 / CBS 8224 / DSM 1558 / NBRC 9311 / NRRL Y-6157 / RJB 2259-6 / UBC 559-6) TaxID=578456 RepID=UPI0003F49691|nr:uncharacterized protein TREMEDRAFT_29286 [Tremella mesenterica DSM 1558]EIW70337.1 hypothetical protein TREMEDRAFT_29286 [Tremella mesenterica DSM 1558]